MEHKFRYKVWDKIAIVKETPHVKYPVKVAEIFEKNNIVEVRSVRKNWDCDIYIEWYGVFYVYADEIMWVVDDITLFV